MSKAASQPSRAGQMARNFLIIGLLAAGCLATSTAQAADDKKFDFTSAWKEADSIRAAVWSLDVNLDAIALRLKRCEADHSDRIGMGECLAKAHAAYEEILASLKMHKGDRDNCQGSICGILTQTRAIAKIREQIAEESYLLGGGQE